jgi:hypothetical protein
VTYRAPADTDTPLAAPALVVEGAVRAATSARLSTRNPNMERFMKRLLTAVAFAVAVVAGSGLAFALDGEANTVNGCYRTKDGSLRVVANADQCDPKHETAIQWNKQGPAGPAGPQGAPGVSGHEVVQVNDKVFIDKTTVVHCPAGKKVLGGGISSPTRQTNIWNSAPIVGGDGWVVSVTNERTFPADNPFEFGVYAVCAYVS